MMPKPHKTLIAVESTPYYHYVARVCEEPCFVALIRLQARIKSIEKLKRFRLNMTMTFSI